MDEERIPLLDNHQYEYSFDNLPEEIMQKIIGYSEDSYNSTARVSRKFNDWTYTLNFANYLEKSKYLCI